jgi:hypothetical protein
MKFGSIRASGQVVATGSISSNTTTLLTGSGQLTNLGYSTTGSNLFKGDQTFSGSLIPSVNGVYDLGDPTHEFRHLYLSSASLYIDGTKVLGSTTQELQITTDTGQSFKILEAGSDTITLQSNDGNITLATSGGGDVIMDPTNGVIALKGTTTIYSGFKIVSSDGNNIQLGDGLTVTGSIVSTTTPLVSGSSQITYSGLSGIPSGIISGSLQVSGFGLATTGSNNFQGTQTITGSLFISSDLVVQGSSSLQNITASAVSIGANIVNLNTANPAIRFAGLNVFDSGSIGGSGSLLYDAVQDEFIFVHRGDGTNVTSSVVMVGPQTYNNLGSETYPTTNRILKSVGNEHIGDSIIGETGGGIGIGGSLSVTGSIVATNFSGSSSGTNTGDQNLSNYLTLDGTQTITGIKTINNNLLFANSGTGKRGIQGVSGVNDYWFIGGGATAENTGFLEIATGDDAQTTGTSEPIYVSQYGPGDALTGTLFRRATLLDANGNTSFPGTVTAPTFSGNLSGNATNITSHTINQSVGTGNNVSFAGATLGCGISTGRGAYGPGALNLVLLSSSSGSDGVSGIDFRSGNNYPSDGATIYYENSQTGTGEVSRLVFRVENDLNDSILMRAGYHVYNARTVDNASQGADNPIFRWQYLDSNRMSLDSSGNLVCSGGISGNGSPSDARLKTIKETVKDPIKKIMKISGYRFDWNEINTTLNIKEDVGVIAQEISDILPELTRTDQNGYMSVRYQGLTALFIEAIKEQQGQIEELKEIIKRNNII